MRRAAAFLVSILLAAAFATIAACATAPAPAGTPHTDPDPDVLLLGEQHDAPLHAQLERDAVAALAARRAAAALVLEMAPAGHSTAALAASASEDVVRRALAWDELGWPWERYREPVMAAVRAGVPVLGADLPRPRLADAARDATLDSKVSEQVLQSQRDAVRSGHCGLLPERQVAPMARVQVGRDVAMAQAIAQAAVPGKTVVMIAGGQHADPSVGIPLHLPATLRVRTQELPHQPQARDYCEELRKHWARPGGRTP